MVVQKESEASKVAALQKHIAALEQALGQKQMIVDYQEKLIEEASKELGMDIKKYQCQTLEYFRQHPNQHCYPMKALYAHCQISKQGHYQMLARQLAWQEKEALLLRLMLQIREIHPAMRLRTMYEFYQPERIGRDAFISIGLHYGLRVKAFCNETRTTFASPYSRYANLLKDVVVDHINQVWTSDITYFRIGEAFAYIVFILDVYSRLIVGYSVNEHMSRK